MTLNEQLQAIREKSRERIPAASRAIMERAVDDLRRSGAVDRVVKVGERAPDFKLPNAAGRPVDLAHLRGHGPVVLSFFRGRCQPRPAQTRSARARTS
jgi:AhpC/TSA family